MEKEMEKPQNGAAAMEKLHETDIQDKEIAIQSMYRLISSQCPDNSDAAVMKNIVDEFAHMDTSIYIKQKQGLSYLSWAKAWEIVLSIYPGAHYDIFLFNGKPYMTLPGGVMVWTAITIEGQMRYMWLPVMDLRNKAVTEESMDALQLNKTLMRCMVKNLAMFNLGINLYFGEDLPTEVAKDKKKLESGIKKIITLGNKLAETNKEGMKQAIAKLNNGSSNPYDIDDVQVCDAVIAALEELSEKGGN